MKISFNKETWLWIADMIKDSDGCKKHKDKINRISRKIVKEVEKES